MSETPHPRLGLSEIIHQPVRFSIVAALAAAESLDFSSIRNAVQVSDSVLSKQLAILEQAGFVAITKGFVGKRPRTWAKLTPVGRAAWLSNLEILRRIANAAAPNPPEPL